MKAFTISLLTFLAKEVAVSSAFFIPSPSFSFTKKSISCISALPSGESEFDYLLGEGRQETSQKLSQVVEGKEGKIVRKNIVGLPESSAAATLTSSVSAPMQTDGFTAADDIYGDGVTSESSEVDSTEQQTSDPRLSEYIRKEEQRIAIKSQPVSRIPISQSIKNFMKDKDFGEILVFVFVPITAGYWLTKRASAEVNSRLATKAEEVLDDYANEMVYHDGDFEEMKMCHSDYNKKLVWLGPKKSDAMIKRYLEFYAKKKTVSPQAISSLSYVFSMYKLSEDRASQILVELCSTMPEKAASAGKLLFFGTHILKTKEAKSRLQPIKDMLASSYRDLGTVSGEEIVEKSQIAMGEAAYRAAVSSAGKKQTDLTVGWEVLGLDKEKATEIWSEVAKEGFMSSREAKYGTASQKYDEKGRKLDKEGELVNPEEATDDDDEDDDVPTGNVFECGECGYTLFVAEGRDFKFFGADFKCPECGAPKDKFVGVDVEEE